MCLRFVLLLWFYSLGKKKNRYIAPYLLFWLLGALESVFTWLYAIEGKKDFPDPDLASILVVFQIGFTFLSGIFFYKWFITLWTPKNHTIHNLLFGIVQIVGIFCLLISIPMFQYDQLYTYFIQTGIMLAYIQQSYTIIIIAVPFYWRLLQIESNSDLKKQWKKIVIMFFLAGLMSFYTAISYLLPLQTDYFKIMQQVVMMLAVVFFLSFTILFLRQLDLFYRLPCNVSQLIVAFKSGVPIFQASFVNFKKVEMDEMLITGVLTSVSTLFKTALQSSGTLEKIIGSNAAIMIKSGRHVNAILVGDILPPILEHVLGRFVQIFETNFQHDLKQEITNITRYQTAMQYITTIFPFYVIKEDGKKA